MFLSEEGDWGCGWHAAGEEVVWAPPGGGDVAGPLAAGGCPAAASSLSTGRLRTLKGAASSSASRRQAHPLDP